jgi:hypothetical protein
MHRQTLRVYREMGGWVKNDAGLFAVPGIG